MELNAGGLHDTYTHNTHTHTHKQQCTVRNKKDVSNAVPAWLLNHMTMMVNHMTMMVNHMTMMVNHMTMMVTDITI